MRDWGRLTRAVNLEPPRLLAYTNACTHCHRPLAELHRPLCSKIIACVLTVNTRYCSVVVCFCTFHPVLIRKNEWDEGGDETACLERWRGHIYGSLQPWFLGRSNWQIFNNCSGKSNQLCCIIPVRAADLWSVCQAEEQHSVSIGSAFLPSEPMFSVFFIDQAHKLWCYGKQCSICKRSLHAMLTAVINVWEKYTEGFWACVQDKTVLCGQKVSDLKAECSFQKHALLDWLIPA